MTPVAIRQGRLRLFATATAAVAIATATASCHGDDAKSVVPEAPTALADGVGLSGQAQQAVCPPGAPTVHDAAGLESALASASPGAVIRMADGTYTGEFVVTKAGTEGAPIWLCGSTSAVLDGGDEADYVLHLDHASFVRLVGFSVRNGKKGVMADATQHSVIAGLSVSAIGDEAIHLRDSSSDNLVTGNTVRDTGHRSAKFGEGIYIGSANNNWCKISNCNPDASDRNFIIGNNIAGTTAENIDVKEGSTGGLISGNVLSSDRMTDDGGDSWIDLKGNGWIVEKNTGKGGGALKDGIQEHVVKEGWGRRNIIRNNTLVVNATGFGIYLHDKDVGNVVGCDNQVVGAAAGFSNAACS
ncbi:right-handed parallel beta-helix repeat-containing protein [Frankia sp. CiP3]|uniref:right-handed parallel beta-helix repeat-containing protein n=1 Tax=Frankia sp. CiP3 TaxID=2880971 RepID=UPI001EF4AE84|nr:right-handed parallel beta-helix repeat-containing protein [Frankia sp. CiP3]